MKGVLIYKVTIFKRELILNLFFKKETKSKNSKIQISSGAVEIHAECIETCENSDGFNPVTVDTTHDITVDTTVDSELVDLSKSHIFKIHDDSNENNNNDTNDGRDKKCGECDSHSSSSSSCRRAHLTQQMGRFKI